MASLTLCDESITYGTVHSGITSQLITSTLKEGNPHIRCQGHSFEIKRKVSRRGSLSFGIGSSGLGQVPTTRSVLSVPSGQADQE